MASIGAVVFNRLNSVSAIRTAVDGNILPEYRDDLSPVIVYDLTINDLSESYGGAQATNYEVTISVIANTYAKAVETADLVIANLNYANWVDSSYTILGVFFKDRDESFIEQASKNNRLAVVDLRFDFVVKATS